MAKIKTRVLIISDTHAAHPQKPLPTADIALHCGDLTFNSRAYEYQATFELLRSIAAPLKLVIPGNHDTCLDPVYWSNRRRMKFLGEDDGDSLPDQARAIAEAARKDGVLLTEEQKTQTFVLKNGAKITVFSSPWTPKFGGWGFQYFKGQHRFDIPRGVDVAMTHGPAWGQLDEAMRGGAAGCKTLLGDLEAARPRVHCCGHIHEAWGAKVVKWAEPKAKSTVGQEAQEAQEGEANTGRAAKDLVDEGRSRVLERLEPSDDEDSDSEANARWGKNGMARSKFVKTESPGHRLLSLCGDDGLKLEDGDETLFINAAMMDLSYHPVQPPWLLEMELDEATEEDRKNAVSWEPVPGAEKEAEGQIAEAGDKEAQSKDTQTDDQQAKDDQREREIQLEVEQQMQAHAAKRQAGKQGKCTKGRCIVQ